MNSDSVDSASSVVPLRTPLFGLHERWGGKMVDFAGYHLPVFYGGGGLLAEHLHTRADGCASVFDVSHMGQVVAPAAAAGKLAGLMPADPSALAEGMSKYTVLTNDDGGVIDDCIIANDGARGFFIVLNASRKAVDMAHLRAAGVELTEHSDRALVAVQGPGAVAAVSALFDGAAQLKFMQNLWAVWQGAECRVSRCGYTGEDGYEISVPADAAVALTEALMRDAAAVKPAGLGARDSLRLEAGLCLYGQELDEATSPIEAGLTWAIPKSRRVADAGFAGAAVIAGQIADGAPRKLIGVLPQSKAPVRAGAVLTADGQVAGTICSGVHSPSLGVPVAMAYVRRELAAAEEFAADVRGKTVVCKRATLPFVPHRYVR